MIDEKKVSDKKEHTVCHNPCPDCQNTGTLENGEVCPACGGTGCKDEMTCSISGGLDCDT